MRTFNLFLGVILVVAAHCQPGSQRLRLDEQSLAAAYPLLRTAVLDAIRASGGDPETQHIHWVFGFSTGHFAKDPTAAEAKRHLASKLLSELAIPGDRVSTFAWEMDVWDHSDGTPRTMIVRSQQDILSFHELLPRTPRQGTIGGHDTERAFTEVVQMIGNPQDAILILMTPTAASIAAPGTKVWGQNHPSYLAALKNWVRITNTSTGASVELPFRVIKDQGEVVDRRFEILIFVPRRFAGTRIQNGSRSANTLQINATKPEEPEPQPSSATRAPQPRARPGAVLIPLLVILVVLVALAWILKDWLFPPPVTVTVNNEHSRILRSKKEGIILAGTDDVALPEGWHRVVIRGAPRQEIARISRNSAGILVRASYNTTMQIDDITHNEYTVKAGDDARIEFRGVEPTVSGLPDKEWQFEVVLSAERTQG